MKHLLLFLSIVGFGLGGVEAKADTHTVQISVAVPEGTPAVYLTGNRPELGPWDPRKFAMTKQGGRYIASLAVPNGFDLEFKFTLGSWEREAVNADGSVPPNHRVRVDGDKRLEFTISAFKQGGPAGVPGIRGLPRAEGSGVLGTLKYHHDVASKHLKFTRHVAVWLPPGYDEEPDRRYAVLYMHDGQNLFDPRIAFTGTDWGIDEAVVRLVEAGKIPPIIVVGIFSSPSRITEYNPLTGGDAYARFLVEELKPMIDSTYRTLPAPRHTGTMGSSAGGLISLGLGWKPPGAGPGAGAGVFTRIGALSAHLPPIPGEIGGTGESILDKIEASDGLDPSLRIYVDRSESGIDASYGPHHERLRKMLTGRGWKEGQNLMVRDFPGTAHTEADWRKRVDVPLEFLFGELRKE